jgi:hypothetical protein
MSYVGFLIPENVSLGYLPSPHTSYTYIFLIHEYSYKGPFVCLFSVSDICTVPSGTV